MVTRTPLVKDYIVCIKLFFYVDFEVPEHKARGMAKWFRGSKFILWFQVQILYATFFWTPLGENPGSSLFRISDCISVKGIWKRSVYVIVSY